MDELDRIAIGKMGEEITCIFLEAMGLEVLDRNWRCRFGEADIVAMDADGTLCFVEVKTRRSVEAGIPEESITPEKRRRYERIAMCYLMESKWVDAIPVRFDCCGICLSSDTSLMLRYHTACFDGCC